MMNWPAKAAELGALIETVHLHPQALGHLEKTDKLIGIACSGGADSLAALLLLYHHLPKIRSRMVVLHFNHKLRGMDSDDDEAFVVTIASALKLGFRGACWKRRDQQLHVSELKARDARLEFFEGFLLEHPESVIVTGHQQDDILETLMLRIARSSGLAGLAAPRPVQLFESGKVMVRPLLNLTKGMLEAALRECDIPWREDATNLEPLFDRNKLRKEVIPRWQQATQFDLTMAASKVRNYLEEADEVLEAFLEVAQFSNPQLNPAPLPDRSMPRGAIRRWLQHWLAARGLGGRFKQSLFEDILDTVILGKEGLWNAGDGNVRVTDVAISTSESPADETPGYFEFTLSSERQIQLPNKSNLASKMVRPSYSLLKDLENGKYSELSTVLIDSETLPEETLVIRSWKPGDRYRPLNSPGSRKLQDMFVDRKIPQAERNHLPVVLTTDSIILWCPGLPVNHQFRVTKKTNKILQLTYTFLP